MNISTVEKIYTLTGFNYLMTLDNGDVWSVPNDESNADYQKIQEWAAIDGNTIIDNPPE